MTAFPGFSEELVSFLKNLAANNNKDWFAVNRKTYDEAYVTSALDFIEALAPHVRKLSPPLQAMPKLNGSLRRIHRDVRFSRDKRPYSTRLHLVFWTGDHPNRAPAMHFVVTDEHLGFGSGQWGFGPDALKRYREAVADERKARALQDAIDTACAGGAYELSAPALARVPRGFDADGPHAGLLRHKGIVVKGGAEGHPPVLYSPGIIDWTLEQIHLTMPLHRWLVENVNG
ncbi:MAG: DUF2461 domain-containing protein [Hyphomicrobiaceae bacterium]|nr:DUF2461 domain-containing protein [Hyphomicrobiaceae bacterium]